MALRVTIELSDGVYGESRNRVLVDLKAFLGTRFVGVGDFVCDGLYQFGVELIRYSSEDDFKPLKKAIRTSPVPIYLQCVAIREH